LRNPCPEFQDIAEQPGELANPAQDLVERANAMASENSKRFAGKWWDAPRQTMVVWLKGNVEEVREELRRSAPEARLCIEGGAKFSQFELEDARRKANRILTAKDVHIQDMMLEVTMNRYRYNAESISIATLEKLENELGAAVRIVAFIAVQGDEPLVEVPSPGNVEIITQRTRGGAQMQALGHFSIEYDQKLACIYLKNSTGERVLPVWPMGFWATREPLQVHDFDGRVVATGGAAIEFSGGEVGMQHFHADNYCGADKVWIGAPVAK
jgi:hypothetical protein